MNSIVFLVVLPVAAVVKIEKQKNTLPKNLK